MTENVVVLGAGYAGTGAITKLQSELGGNARLTWIADVDYHLILHEAHRVIRDPDVRSDITFPVDRIADPSTRFVQDEVTGLDVDEQVVELADGDDVDYDYVLVALGTQTAYYGIPGLEEQALTLKSLDDALEIHDAVQDASEDATRGDPAQIVIGGAGLSGIQTAGEIAEFRDEHRAPVEIHLVEALEEIFPGNDPEIQGAIRKRLENKDVEILTGDFISEADEEQVYLGGGEDEVPEELPYDVLVWTGGITGQEELADVDVEKDERSNRVIAESDFTTSDDNVFAIGDTALVDQGEDDVAPPTAQAAWQAAEVAGENLARAVRGSPLKTWRHEDKGTVISVGDQAVAHDVAGFPITTFGGTGAKVLKKGIASRWIAKVSSVGRAAGAFADM